MGKTFSNGEVVTPWRLARLLHETAFFEIRMLQVDEPLIAIVTTRSARYDRRTYVMDAFGVTGWCNTDSLISVSK